MTGRVALGYGSGGVLVDTGCIGNTIGGTASGAGNVIFGYGGAGVQISSSSSFNVVAGNKIGTDVTGTVALNSGNGIEVDAGCVGNTIGGTALGAGNLIATSGSTSCGLPVTAPPTTWSRAIRSAPLSPGLTSPPISKRASRSTKAPRTIRLAA